MQFAVPQICYAIIALLLLLSTIAASPAYDIPREYRPARRGPNYKYKNLDPTAYGLCTIMDWKCSGYPFGIIANEQGKCPYHDRAAFGLDKKGCCSRRNAPCWSFAATRVNAITGRLPRDRRPARPNLPGTCMLQRRFTPWLQGWRRARIRILRQNADRGNKTRLVTHAVDQKGGNGRWKEGGEKGRREAVVS